MSVKLFGKFLERQIGVRFGSFPPERGDPLEVARLLWVFMVPLQSEPALSYVNTMPYDPRGEADFDLTLERLAANPEAGFHNNSDAALTVWKERLFQAITVLGTNATQNRQVIVPPLALDKPLRQVAAACLWLHRMELPFAPGTIRTISPPGHA